ncbi:hypothetical protein PoB_004032000 [Plakobranchus ocellatus]|uniref:Uncharacterized protein n=1 Tax=Plakobranchus ocellatus TaxID=259542 RepID=A0AAV4B407_9GAST|nr:hypothetical protein PoB_004032000 [Plakobranchus ocellatus]
MTTMTIYDEQSAMAQDVAQHATSPPYTFRTVADDRTGCRNVRPSKPHALCLSYTRRLSKAYHSRVYSGPEYRVLTRRLIRHSKISIRVAERREHSFRSQSPLVTNRCLNY